LTSQFYLDAHLLLTKEGLGPYLIPTKMGVFGRVGKKGMKRGKIPSSLSFSLLLLCSINIFGRVWKERSKEKVF